MPVRSHRASDYLNTPEDIVAYLNAAVEEMGDDPRLLMKAFRNVADARGGVSEVARQAKMDRVALSRALSGQRIPRLDTLAKVSAACGVQLRFSASPLASCDARRHAIDRGLDQEMPGRYREQR